MLQIPIPILYTCTAEMIRGRQAVSRFATLDAQKFAPSASLHTNSTWIFSCKHQMLDPAEHVFQTFLNFHSRPQPDFDCRDCRTARPVITGTFHRNYSHFHCLSSSLHTNWDTIYWDIYMSAKKTI